jgi:tetratricopeptide (TPR) repeat protein
MRGWCLMQLQRPAEAQEAFSRAVEGEDADTRDKKSSAYGATLAALKSGRTDSAYEIANQNSLEPKQRQVVNKEILTQRAIAAFRNEDYRSTLYSLNELRKIAAEPRDLAQLRGWSLYYLGDLRGAEAVFTAIDSTYSTVDSRRALTTVRRKKGGRGFEEVDNK